MYSNVNRLNHQKGVASLEFIVVAPLLFMIVFAVSELGWALHQYQSMTRASRDGARYMASNALIGSVGMIYLDEMVTQKARNLVVYGNVTGTGEPNLPGWSISDIAINTPDAEHVEVSARYGYTPILARLPAFYGGDKLSLNFIMRSTVIMRAL